MRSILQNVVAFDTELRTGFQLGTVHQTITATYQMAQDQPPILFVGTGGAAQIVVLPSIAGLSVSPGVPDGRVHIVIVEGAGGNATVTIEAHADDNFAVVGSQITSQKGGLMLIADAGTSATPKFWVPITIP